MKLAIIGSGIAGCASAYFSRKHVPDLEKITIYEKSERYGGRLYFIKVDSIINEIGATFFHTINLNMQFFVNKFGLEVDEYAFPTLGVWNGNNFIFKSGFLNDLRLLVRYRLSAWRLLRLIKKAKKEVLLIYDNSRLEKAYTTVEELLGIPYIKQLISKSLYDVLREAGISDKLIYELLEPGVRYIYCQNINIGGFAGIATIVASDRTPIHKLKMGNVTLLEKLVDEAQAQIKLNHKVTKISKTENKSYIIEGDSFKDEYDAVILAAPIEQLCITFSGLNLPVMEYREFQRVYVNILTGEINSSYFGMQKPEEVPEMLMTVSDFKGSFNNIEMLGKTKDGENIYNLIAVEPIPNELMDQLFFQKKLLKEHVWEYAYPKSKPIKKFQPIVLNKRLYYVNAVESAASTMEASILGAKNIALLLKKSLG
ncbi:MAG: FAD-dependent oxidoreductase [Candidatus Hodarchaeota archaeon]